MLRSLQCSLGVAFSAKTTSFINYKPVYFPIFTPPFASLIHTLTLYTKNPCPLCDEAKEQIKQTLKEHENKVIFEQVDITDPGNETWYKLYKYDIPVFHLNGKFLMKHRADVSLLSLSLEQLKS